MEFLSVTSIIVYSISTLLVASGYGCLAFIVTDILREWGWL